jgi:hypothetical protein
MHETPIAAYTVFRVSTQTAASIIARPSKALSPRFGSDNRDGFAWVVEDIFNL